MHKKAALISIAIVTLVIIVSYALISFPGISPFKPSGISSIQEITIESEDIEQSGNYLRVSVDITDDQKSTKIIFPSKVEINETAYWEFNKPIEIFITPEAFYSIMSIGKLISQPSFQYGLRPWYLGCTGKFKTVTYNRLGNPLQEAVFKTEIRQDNSLVGREYTTISANKPSNFKIKDIEVDFPGWLSRGSVPPLRDYIIKEGQIYEERDFNKNFIIISPDDPRRWKGWLVKYGECDTDYTDKQIFSTGVMGKDDKWWLPPYIYNSKNPDYPYPLPRGVSRIEISETDVKWHHPKVYGLTGRVTITLPASFVGAKIIEVKKVMDIEITSVEGNTENFVGGETRTFLVGLKNDGNDRGIVTVSVAGPDFYGSNTGEIEANGRTVITLPITAKFRDKYTSVPCDIIAYAANKEQDRYKNSCSITVEEVPSGPDDGDEIPDETVPVKGNREVVIDSSTGTIQFTGNNVYKGRILAINVKPLKVEQTITDNLINAFKDQNIEYVTSSKYSLLTSDKDVDAIKASGLMKLDIVSENTMNVTRNGILIEENVMEYTYTHPILKFLSNPIVLVILFLSAIYIFVIRDKESSKKRKK